MNMILSARQLQEKCIEQDMDLYQVFIDLTKAFDSINRIALWEIPKKLGCPEKFVRMLRQFHDKAEVRVKAEGILSDPISVENCVKQGNIPAPTLFAMYFTIVFQIAFEDCTEGVYRDKGQQENCSISKDCAKIKVLHSHLIEFLCANNCDPLAHSKKDMQHMLNAISAACAVLGLMINFKKTVIMYQPTLSKMYVEPFITVNGQSAVKCHDKSNSTALPICRSVSVYN
eukprot:XP_014767746.1 PREDICTED: uncharacterized protein LOC106867398 [Octopus bimaculoides]